MPTAPSTVELKSLVAISETYSLAPRYNKSIKVKVLEEKVAGEITRDSHNKNHEIKVTTRQTK